MFGFSVATLHEQHVLFCVELKWREHRSHLAQTSKLLIWFWSSALRISRTTKANSIWPQLGVHSSF